MVVIETILSMLPELTVAQYVAIMTLAVLGYAIRA